MGIQIKYYNVIGKGDNTDKNKEYKLRTRLDKETAIFFAEQYSNQYRLACVEEAEIIYKRKNVNYEN